VKNHQNGTRGQAELIDQGCLDVCRLHDLRKLFLNKISVMHKPLYTNSAIDHPSFYTNNATDHPSRVLGVF